MPDKPVALFISLYLDADVNRGLVDMLRAEGLEAVSAWDLGYERWDDGEQLAYAVSQQMAILTHNTDDYALLAKAYAQAGREHYGIIVSAQLPLGEMRRRVLQLLDRVTADEMRNAFRYLSDFADRP